jgi:hypothetical protein
MTIDRITSAFSHNLIIHALSGFDAKRIRGFVILNVQAATINHGVGVLEGE